MMMTVTIYRRLERFPSDLFLIFFQLVFRVDNPEWTPGSELPQKVCMLSKPGGDSARKCRPRSLAPLVLFAKEGAPKVINTIKRCKCY